MSRYLLGLLSVAGFGLQAQTTWVNLHPNGVETNEPSIAIDPKYPGTQILGSNTSYFFISDDGGFNWTPKLLEPPEGFYGDPVTWITSQGHFYLCHLAKNPKKDWPNHFDRIVFEKSFDQGKTFTSIGVGANGNKIQDKPWIAVDEAKKSPFRDRVYLSWTEFDKYESSDPADSSRIRMVHSGNFGDTFSKAVTVSDVGGDAMDSDTTLEGATIATGPRGEVYCVWAGRNKIWFDKSLDGGKTWGKDKAIQDQKGSWNLQEVPGLMRANSMPFAQCDNKGNIYVIFGDSRNGDQDIFLIWSKDQGETWSPAIRVNNDATGNGADQYMPHVAVDKKSGCLYVVYYDRRHSENNRFTDVYLTTIKKGKPVKHFRVTNESFAAPGKSVFFGDYIGIALAGKEVRVAATLYDHEKLIATVRVAMLSTKILSKNKTNEKLPYIKVFQAKDLGYLLVHAEIPQAVSGTLEIQRAGMHIMKQLFNPMDGSPIEVKMPLNKLSYGLYHVSFSFQGKKIESDFYIER